MGGKSYLDQDKAIREVERGFDILKQLRSLFQFESRNAVEEAVVLRNLELAEPLFTEALQALHHALSIMNTFGVIQAGATVEKKSEIPVLESSFLLDGSLGRAVSFDHSTQTQRYDDGRGKRKMVEVNSWMNKTSMPHDDGHPWRKYGDKKITGSSFTRSYFRCTYKEKQGCQAKKIVQFEPTSDRHAPSFKATYINKHTWNLYSATTSASSFQLPVAGSPLSMEQDIGVNQVPGNAVPPQPLDQGSGFLEADNLGEAWPFLGHSTAGNDWYMDYLMMDNLEELFSDL